MQTDFTNLDKKALIMCLLVRCTLIISLSFCISATALNFDKYGYLAFCPCMGRFGNQADQFLGVLAFGKSLNRTLILPPWVEYRYGEPKSIQVPFKSYFQIEPLNEYHKVITMEDFMKTIAPTLWPDDRRISFCYTKRHGEIEDSCNAKSGNPFGPFWDEYSINFVGSEFYGPLHYDAHNADMMLKWKRKYPPGQWPVLAFTGAPASFPVQKENIGLQKYLKWSNEIVDKTKAFIRDNMAGGGFLGVHLRNGQDWLNACEHVKDSSMLFSAPQCVGYKNERGPLSYSMCYPKQKEIMKQIKRSLKKVPNIKYIFVASDSNHMINDFKSALHMFDVKVLKLNYSNPHEDLAILGQANHFIGNCVSSYSAFVKRERDVKDLSTEFWSFPSRKKGKHEEL